MISVGSQENKGPMERLMLNTWNIWLENILKKKMALKLNLCELMLL